MLSTRWTVCSRRYISSSTGSWSMESEWSRWYRQNTRRGMWQLLPVPSASKGRLSVWASCLSSQIWTSLELWKHFRHWVAKLLKQQCCVITSQAKGSWILDNWCFLSPFNFWALSAVLLPRYHARRWSTYFNKKIFSYQYPSPPNLNPVPTNDLGHH